MSNRPHISILVSDHGEPPHVLEGPELAEFLEAVYDTQLDALGSGDFDEVFSKPHPREAADRAIRFAMHLLNELQEQGPPCA